MPTVGVDPATIEQAVIPPLDWILIRLDPPLEGTDSGIIVPVHPPARTGVVVRRGPGALAEDGRTRLPMHCDVGDRVLFERAAGKNLPRVPRETQRPVGSSPGRWAYILIRDGSVCATVGHEPVGEHERRALDSGDAGLPPRPGDVPVSRCGPMAWERLEPVQDWLVMRADMRPEVVDAAPRGVLRPARKLHRANGSAKLLLEEKAPVERYDLWSGTVLKRGAGLLTVTRCLDGDRVGRAPWIVKEGDRCLFSGAPPHVQAIRELDPFAPGAEVLMREYPCVVAKLV